MRDHGEIERRKAAMANLAEKITGQRVSVDNLRRYDDAVAGRGQWSGPFERLETIASAWRCPSCRGRAEVRSDPTHFAVEHCHDPGCPAVAELDDAPAAEDGEIPEERWRQWRRDHDRD